MMIFQIKYLIIIDLDQGAINQQKMNFEEDNIY